MDVIEGLKEEDAQLGVGLGYLLMKQLVPGIDVVPFGKVPELDDSNIQTGTEEYFGAYVLPEDVRKITKNRRFQPFRKIVMPNPREDHPLAADVFNPDLMEYMEGNTKVRQWLTNSTRYCERYREGTYGNPRRDQVIKILSEQSERFPSLKSLL